MDIVIVDVPCRSQIKYSQTVLIRNSRISSSIQEPKYPPSTGTSKDSELALHVFYKTRAVIAALRDAREDKSQRL